MRWILTLIICILAGATVSAQSISVENFRHLKNPLWKRIMRMSNIGTDKNAAIIDLTTSQKGWTFRTAGDEELAAEDNDGVLTIKVPHKTKYIIISHPNIGDYTWRVPMKELKKKNRYVAELSFSDLTREFTNPYQWLTFTTSPEQCVVRVDSTFYSVRDGKMELYLPLGTHGYSVESPFYETVTDSVNLTTERRTDVKVFLEPSYSFLTVKGVSPGDRLYVDGKFLGETEATSTRLAAGRHRVSAFSGDRLVADSIVELAPAEKKTLELSPLSHQPEHTYSTVNDTRAVVASAQLKTEPLVSLVSITAEDSLTVIKVDRETVGTGKWAGKLSAGFHLLTAERDGVESVAQFIDITDSSPRDIQLVVPQSSLGMVNIKSNVADAIIVSGNRAIGTVPMIVGGLRADEIHKFILHKPGYKDRTVTVRPEGNSIIDLYVELKKN